MPATKRPLSQFVAACALAGVHADVERCQPEGNGTLFIDFDGEDDTHPVMYEAAVAVADAYGLEYERPSDHGFLVIDPDVWAVRLEYDL